MKTKHIRFNIEIETLSPVHIGNGNKLSSVGDFYNTGSRIIYLDNDRLLSEVQKKGLMDDYISKILQENIGLNFYNALIDWGINPENYKTKELPLYQKEMKSTFNDELHLHIKTNDKAYFPGSSIKGMIRTAFIFDFYKKFPNYLKNLERSIEKIIGNINPSDDNIEKKKKRIKNNLKKLWAKNEKQFFPDFVFHILRITDSKSFDNTCLSVEQVRRVLFFESTEEGVDWLEECISTGNKTIFELSIMPDILDETIDFYFSNKNINQNEFYINDWDFLEKAEIEKIFSKINDYTIAQINEEKMMLSKIVKNIELREKLNSDLDHILDTIAGLDTHAAISRIGSGKTIFFETLLPILSKEIKEKLIFILKKEETESLFPATRVLCVDDNKMKGWIKLSL